MKATIAHLTVQRWGNSLAVRIPAGIARQAHFQTGTPVEVMLQDNGIAVRPTGEKILTLDERLAKFDPNFHGGEVMISDLVGLERFK